MSEDAAAPREPVSLVVVNARVWTANPRRPWADAVAVRGERFAAVSSGAEVRKLAGASRVVDALGALLVPHALGALAEGPVGEADAGGAPVLERGGMADFVLLDRALPDASPESLRGARLRMVVSAGRIVHDSDAGVDVDNTR